MNSACVCSSLVSCCRLTCCNSRCQPTCQSCLPTLPFRERGQSTSSCLVILVPSRGQLIQGRVSFWPGGRSLSSHSFPIFLHRIKSSHPKFLRSFHSLTFNRSISTTLPSTLKGGSTPQLPLDKGAGLPLRRLARVQIQTKIHSRCKVLVT